MTLLFWLIKYSCLLSELMADLLLGSDRKALFLLKRLLHLVCLLLALCTRKLQATFDNSQHKDVKCVSNQFDLPFCVLP